jgi:hypothetical protein
VAATVQVAVLLSVLLQYSTATVISSKAEVAVTVQAAVLLSALLQQQ